MSELPCLPLSVLEAYVFASTPGWMYGRLKRDPYVLDLQRVGAEQLLAKMAALVAEEPPGPLPTRSGAYGYCLLAAWLHTQDIEGKPIPAPAAVQSLAHRLPWVESVIARWAQDQERKREEQQNQSAFAALVEEGERMRAAFRERLLRDRLRRTAPRE